MKRAPSPANKLSLTDLAGLRDQLKHETQTREAERQRAEAATRKTAKEVNVFRANIGEVSTLRQNKRVERPHNPPAPEPVHSRAEGQTVLCDSPSDEFDVDNLPETDDALSYRCPGISDDVLKKLRRGEWAMQDQIDLHGMRREEAREALAASLCRAVQRGIRCVRMIHGKGLGSPDKTPMLKGKVRSWLVQKEEVIAFVEPRNTTGGAGAVLVLLRQPYGSWCAALFTPVHNKDDMYMHVARLRLVMHWVEILAVFSFAISGLVEAKWRRLDAVGAFIVTFLTAFGSDTLRGLLLDRWPFYWIEHEQYLLALFVMSLFANWVTWLVSQLVPGRMLIVIDTIGMGFFGMLGTQLAFDTGVPIFVLVMIGVITAAFGGLLRDVVCSEVPMPLWDNHPYATCAFLGCFLYAELTQTDLLPNVSVVIATLAIVIGRLMTPRQSITLPR